MSVCSADVFIVVVVDDDAFIRDSLGQPPSRWELKQPLFRVFRSKAGNNIKL